MSIFLQNRSNIAVPYRCQGDTRIIFRGSGLARFRLLHGASKPDGSPDFDSFVEVSAMSDARLADPRDALGEDGVTVVGGVLIDFVEYDWEYRYRRHSADWLQLVLYSDPWDYSGDDKMLDACAAYTLSFEPLP